jgi:hypothetical protein
VVSVPVGLGVGVGSAVAPVGPVGPVGVVVGGVVVEPEEPELVEPAGVEPSGGAPGVVADGLEALPLPVLGFQLLVDELDPVELGWELELSGAPVGLGGLELPDGAAGELSTVASVCVCVRPGFLVIAEDFLVRCLRVEASSRCPCVVLAAAVVLSLAGTALRIL